MTDNELDSYISKLVDYAKDKKQITWDELNELLAPEVIKDTEKMSKIYNALQEHSILFVEDDGLDEDDMLDDETEVEDDDVKDIESDRKRMVYNDKTSTSDDPIKLYLREIGKEHLLTAEQEVELSKKMEDGENIIKDVIKHSGMMIPEFYAVAQKAFSRIDPHEPGKARKEINEEMAERRRLRSFYSEILKQVLPDMKQYMQLKKQLYETDASRNIFDDEELIALRNKILPDLQKMDIQSEEIEKFSGKFIDATKKIAEYRHRQERKAKELRITDYSDLRSLGRKLAIKSECVHL